MTTPDDTEAQWQAIQSQFNIGAPPLLPEIEDLELGDANSLLQFMQQGHAEGYEVQNWVIPGFLEARDKIVITGPSGRGKSTLCRQVAITASAGRYPFDRPGTHHDGREYEPKRVALLDCENRPRQMYRGMAQLLRRISNQYGETAQKDALHNLFINVREDGMELTSDVHKGSLINWLDEVEPDLIVIGPLYYLTYRDPNEHGAAQQLAKTLRNLATRYDAALMVEAHSSKPGNGPARLDPQGSNIWVKWPDHGRSIQEADKDCPNLFKLAHFRGDREPKTEMPDYITLDWQSLLTKDSHPGKSMLPWYLDWPPEL